MRVLIITTELRWANAIEAILPKGNNLSVWRPDELDQNAGILQAIDVCFVADRSIGPGTINTISRVRSNRDTAIFAVADTFDAEYEELALIAGARQVFTYPLRARIVIAAFEHLPKRPTPASTSPFTASAAQPVSRSIENGEILAVLRDFSRLLPHAVDGPNFLAEYLRRLREVLRCSRLILHLTEIHSAEKALKCVFASGVDPRAFEAIRLTPAGGIPRLLIQRGSLIQRSRLREQVPAENEALRELDVFGTEFAVPLSARDGFVGLLLVGSRIAGCDYTESELTLLFHLMEELGAAVRNAELHADLLRERTTFSAVLQALPIGCLVLRGDHRILHANQVMRQLLGTSLGAVPKWEDLPGLWASGAYEVLHRRVESHESVVDHVIDEQPRKLRLTIKSLDQAQGDIERSVTMTAVDVTAEMAAKTAQALDDADPLLPRVGASLANEFRHLFTPFHVVSQLAGSGAHPEAMTSILGQLAGASQRIQRRIDNLAYLAPEALAPSRTRPKDIVAQAQQRVQDLVTPAEFERIKWSGSTLEESTTADEKAVSMALSELVLNALEASSAVVDIIVELDAEHLTIHVINTGDWIGPRTHLRHHRPFISTKNAVGIGIEVATRVAKSHEGTVTARNLPNNKVEVLLRLPRNPRFASEP